MIYIHIALMLIFCHHTISMLIPQDIELLDGYDIESPVNLQPEEGYLEARSLEDGGPMRAIRNRRSLHYHTLESSGLRSHFHIDSIPSIVMGQNFDLQDADEFENAAQTRRQKRSEASTEEELQPSQLPTPEKQVMDPSYYRKSNWNVQSFNGEYSKIQQDEEDNLAEAATINEGIKGRTPRVNFITQPKKMKDENKERSPNPNGYQFPEVKPQRYEKMESRMFDDYPSRSYDPYLRRYDRYDDQYNRYDPYYEDYYIYRRRYDPYDSYSPRKPSYPEAYYEYPDRRYDVPEPRNDYRPLYSNDIYDRPPPSNSNWYSTSYTPTYPPTYSPSYSPPYSPSYPNPSYTNRNRRIIYYAHLPEVIRAPPSVDLTYRYGRDRPAAGYNGAITSVAQQPYRSGNENTNRDGMDFVKREKKDYRNFGQSGQKGTPDNNRKPEHE